MTACALSSQDPTDTVTESSGERLLFSALASFTSEAVEAGSIGFRQTKDQEEQAQPEEPEGPDSP